MDNKHLLPQPVQVSFESKSSKSSEELLPSVIVESSLLFLFLLSLFISGVSLFE
ncbi:MAG: hypothetical protein GX275_09155 [Clostridiales bacterium]|nr:hypothetical protein [Clostridiales bacterium]